MLIRYLFSSILTMSIHTVMNLLNLFVSYFTNMKAFGIFGLEMYCRRKRCDDASSTFFQRPFRFTTRIVAFICFVRTLWTDIENMCTWHVIYSGLNKIVQSVLFRCSKLCTIGRVQSNMKTGYIAQVEVLYGTQHFKTLRYGNPRSGTMR